MKKRDRSQKRQKHEMLQYSIINLSNEEQNKEVSAEKTSNLLQQNVDLLYKLQIRQLACSKDHILLLSMEGFVYSMGSNENGKLGVGKSYHELTYANTPIKVQTLTNVCQIAVGEEHSLALTKDFKVFGWGLAEQGAIGMRLSNAKVPNEIKVTSEVPAGAQKVKFAVDDSLSSPLSLQQSLLIKEISSGSHHSAFLTVDGDVYTCGNGERGQLGIGIETLKEYKPQRVRLFDENGKPYRLIPKFKQVACGNYHTGFLTESGVVYVSGDNREAQLGMEIPISRQERIQAPDMTYAPLCLDFNLGEQFQVRKLAFGAFSAALSFSGDLYVWGREVGFSKPTLFRPRTESEKPSIEKSIQRVTIQTVLFREIKVIDTTLITQDVDGGLWKIKREINEEYHSRYLEPCISESLNFQLGSKVKDYFFDPQSNSVVILVPDQNTILSQNSDSLERLTSKKLRSIMKARKQGRLRDLTPQRLNADSSSIIIEEQSILDNDHSHTKSTKSLPPQIRSSKPPLNNDRIPFALRQKKQFLIKPLNSCSSSSPSKGKGSRSSSLQERRAWGGGPGFGHQSKSRDRTLDKSPYSNRKSKPKFSKGHKRRSTDSNVRRHGSIERAALIDNKTETIQDRKKQSKNEQQHRRLDRSQGSQTIQNLQVKQTLLTEKQTTSKKHSHSHSRSTVKVAAKDYYNNNRKLVDLSSSENEENTENLNISNMNRCAVTSSIQDPNTFRGVHFKNESTSTNKVIDSSARESHVKSLKRDLQSQQLSSCLASQRNLEPFAFTSTTTDYIHRLTQENQQLKLQIAEKRLLQCEELNQKLHKENEELRRQLGNVHRSTSERKTSQRGRHPSRDINESQPVPKCDRCIIMESQLRETQQTLERSLQNSDRKKDTVINKMGDLAEKFHLEKAKNRQLLSELHRLNETLARFEARILVLTKEKKGIQQELEKYKERMTLSYKLEPSLKYEHKRGKLYQEESDSDWELGKHRAPVNRKRNCGADDSDYCKSNYSNFVKEVLLSTKPQQYHSRQEHLEKPTPLNMENSKTTQEAAEKKKDQEISEEFKTGEGMSRQQPLRKEAATENNDAGQEDYYNNHILRSLERFAQKTVDEKKHKVAKEWEVESSKTCQAQNTKGDRLSEINRFGRDYENLYTKEDRRNRNQQKGNSDSLSSLCNPPSSSCHTDTKNLGEILRPQQKQPECIQTNLRNPFKELLNSENGSRSKSRGRQVLSADTSGVGGGYQNSIKGSIKQNISEMKEQMAEFHNQLRTGKSPDHIAIRYDNI